MTAGEHPKLGAILLAAGGSTRLGRPKQLVEFEGETLLHRAARTVAAAEYSPVVVVLGAEANTSRAAVHGLSVDCIINNDWRSGMSSSIRLGLARLLELEPDANGVIIALCDQPRISAQALSLFALRFNETQAPVIAAAYSGTVGVPALFSSRVFGELASLKGDRGARGIIRDREGVETIEMPEAAFDIDSPADLHSLP